MPEQKQRWTLLEVLDWTRAHFESRGLSSPRLDAEVLLSEILNLPRVMLYARYDQPLQEEELARMRRWVARRAAGVPVARLLGRREFWSLSLEITPEVLVPRPDSEVLIEVSQQRCTTAHRIVDVGTGSGALALALATEFPEATVWGMDSSSAALSVARRNATKLELDSRIRWIESHLLQALPTEAQPVHLMVANLPYIPTLEIAKLDTDVREHDPHLALDGGLDGLDLIRELIKTAPATLCSGGILALESSSSQVQEVAAMLEGAGFSSVEIKKDLSGQARVTSAAAP